MAVCACTSLQLFYSCDTVRKVGFCWLWFHLRSPRLLVWRSNQQRLAVMSAGDSAVIPDPLRAPPPRQDLYLRLATRGGKRRKRAQWQSLQSRAKPCAFLPFRNPLTYSETKRLPKVLSLTQDIYAFMYPTPSIEVLRVTSLIVLNRKSRASGDVRCVYPLCCGVQAQQWTEQRNFFSP